MMDPIRVVLVDPNDGSRDALQRVLATVGEVWIAEACNSYEGALNRIAVINAQMAIVTIDTDPSRAIRLVETLAQNHPSIVVLPASHERDSSLILQVVRAGAREFLTLPAVPTELLEAIRRLNHRRQDECPSGRGPQIIAVTGAAGGVGCTTLAVNVAAALAKTSSHETILADFDLMFGSIDACLDVFPDHTIMEVVQNIDRIDLTLLKRTLTRHESGLFILPRPTAMDDAAKLDPEVLRRVILMLKAAFPTVMVDTSKGLQSSDFIAFEMADVILIVVELDLTCLRNTARLLQLFQQFDGLTERVRLVANRVGSLGTEISIKKAEETLGMSVSWQVPNAHKLFCTARAKGVPIDALAAGSRAHQAILGIAQALRPFPAPAEVKPRKGLFAAFF